MTKHIPNLFTSANLFLGCLSIISTFDGNLEQAAVYIFIAGLFDFFDGFVARALKAYSEIGKQLDSLADMVSFGVAPGMIFYQISQEYLSFGPGFPQFVPLVVVLSYLPFLIPVFSALRLAKFNIDTRQSDSFIGVPTPANALFICSIPFALNGGGFQIAADIFSSTWFLLLYPVISSWLLVAELPLFALKFKNFTWKDNSIRFLFLITCLLLIIAFKFTGISLSILLYVILSTIIHLKNKKS